MADILSTLSRAVTPVWAMDLAAAHFAAAVALLRTALKGRVPRQPLCLLWLLVFARLLVPALRTPSPWQALPAGTWLAGVLVMNAYSALAYLSLRFCLSGAIRAEDGAWEHPAVRSPFILGTIRPRIYLPAGLRGQSRRFVLCHERTHLRRLDHIVRSVCWLALTLRWSDPAAWLAFVLMSHDIEAACDEAVLRQLGGSAGPGYSATLLALAGRRIPAPCLLAFSGGNARRRVRDMPRRVRPNLWIAAMSVVMAALAVACLFTGPIAGARGADVPASPSPSPSQSLTQQRLEPWAAQVLSGQRDFITESGGHADIGSLGNVYPGGSTVGMAKVAVVDLDRDGVDELILWPSIDADSSEDRLSTLGFLILRRLGDTVYSYAPAYRSFHSLKSDGTFQWSGGSSYWGTGTARFEDGGFALDRLTYCEANDPTGEFLCFVERRSASWDEFDLAIRRQEEKPDAAWYVFEDGRLRPAPIDVPIPLDSSALALPVPDLLDADQQLLYRQAHVMYSHLFGSSSEWADTWPGQSCYASAPAVAVHDRLYFPATGLYAGWQDFHQAVLSVFTQRFWEAKNGGDGSEDGLYIDIGGTMHYLDWARGAGGCNENFPETFRLVERTEDSISFIMTGYYSEGHLMDGESPEQRDARLAAGYDYTIDFPMRMVRTQDGWRFDEFHLAGTDCDLPPFNAQHVPAPSLPDGLP